MKTIEMFNAVLLQTNWEEEIRLFGIKLINTSDLLELIVRLFITSFVIFLIVQFLYARKSKRKDYYFSFFAIGVTVFLLCFLLNNIKLQLGFAMGMFAVFGIIRYRTDTIPIKEMTYLFVVIAVAVINALSNKKVSYAELVLTNSVLFTGLWLLEKLLSPRTEQEIKLTYEKIENIHSDNTEILLEDLRQRTGTYIHRFRINKIDFLRDVAELTVFYYDNGTNQRTKKIKRSEG